MAAVLAAGPDAVLSHRSAATHWGLLSLTGQPINVTSPRGIRPRSGLVVHRSRLPRDETATLDGIPVTTVPRTLLDLAATTPRRALEQALGQAERRQLTDPLSLPDLVERYPGRRGLATLRTALAERTSDVSRSELEEDFFPFIAHEGLPEPERNVALHLGDRFIEADCLWREQRLIVELDGRATHDTADAFHRDRARDRAAFVAGWTTIRVTWRDLHIEPGLLAADLRAALRRGNLRAG